MTTEFDDDIEDEEDQDDPNDSSVIKTLRREAKDGRKAAKERDQLKSEIVSLRNEKLFRSSKASHLSEKQQRAVLSNIEGEATVELIDAEALDLGFIQAEDENHDDDDAQEQMANAAANGNTGRSSSDTLTAADFGSWDMPRKKDFIDRYPEKFAALKRGENVKLSG